MAPIGPKTSEAVTRRKIPIPNNVMRLENRYSSLTLLNTDVFNRPVSAVHPYPDKNGRILLAKSAIDYVAKAAKRDFRVLACGILLNQATIRSISIAAAVATC